MVVEHKIIKLELASCFWLDLSKQKGAERIALRQAVKKTLGLLSLPDELPLYRRQNIGLALIALGVGLVHSESD
jgi:hypothetical protein